MGLCLKQWKSYMQLEIVFHVKRQLTEFGAVAVGKFIIISIIIILLLRHRLAVSHNDPI